MVTDDCSYSVEFKRTFYFHYSLHRENPKFVVHIFKQINAQLITDFLYVYFFLRFRWVVELSYL